MEPRRFEDLPPKIQKLLHKKGWTYPPDEKLKRPWQDASGRFDGKVHTDPEILREIYLEKGWTWADKTECKSDIAVALDAGVNAFVSLDEDFRTVDEVVVYTCVT